MCMHTNTEIAGAMGRDNLAFLARNRQGAEAIVITLVRQDILKYFKWVK